MFMLMPPFRTESRGGGTDGFLLTIIFNTDKFVVCCQERNELRRVDLIN